MFDQIFGNYLVETGRISKEQLSEVIEREREARVKLGLIAVAEKLMTQEQADEINHVQSLIDRRFGDIAVERGYLTEEQVAQLLKKQGNVYMLFVQTLIDEDLMTLEEIDESLNEYKEDQGFSQSDMDDLVSGDIDRTVRLFLPANSEIYDKLCGIAVRTLRRVINSFASVSKAFLVDELNADNFAMQMMVGDHKIISGFAGSGNSLLSIAVPFGEEEFEQVDIDALDAVGEFTNCVNGLFATDLCAEGIEIDMVPPAFYDHPVVLKGRQFCVFPITIDEDHINFILSVDSDIAIE